MLRPEHRHRHHAAHARQQAGERLHRHASSSPTRPSSAPTPSRTRRASTRTACSSTSRPTRSCGPRRWAPTRQPAGARQALRAARVRARAWPSWATRSSERGARPGVRALQGCWPTRRRSSPTPTWRRWSPTSSYQPRELLRARGAAGGLRHHGHADRDRAAARPRRRRRACRAAVGTGPVDAAYKAIDADRRACPATLLEFAVHAGDRGHRRAGRGHGAHRRARTASARWTRSSEVAARRAHLSRPRRRHRHHRRQRQGLPGGAQQAAGGRRGSLRPTRERSAAARTRGDAKLNGIAMT